MIECIYEDKDNLLWIGTWNGLNCFDRTTGTFKQYFHDSADSTSISGDHITCMLEDYRGDLWIGTRLAGLNRLDRETGKFVRYQHQAAHPNSLSSDMILCLYEDRAHKLWIGTTRGLNLYDRENGSFVHFQANRSNPNSISSNLVYEMIDDPDGNLILATHAGIDIYNPSDTLTPFKHHRMGIITRISTGPQGTTWFGSLNGIYVTDDIETRPQLVSRHSPFNPFSLTDNKILDIYHDREGILWVSTFLGLNQLLPEYYQFRHFEPDPTDTLALVDDGIISLHEGKNGRIWMSLEESGLSSFNPGTGIFTRYPFGAPGPPAKMSSGQTMTVYEDKNGTIWLGLGGSGLDLFKPETGSFQHFSFRDLRFRNWVTYFFEDSKGRMWVGTQGGINRLNPSHNDTNMAFAFFPYAPDKPSTNSGEVSGILEADNGELWISTNSYGLRRFDPETEVMTDYRFDRENEFGLSSNTIHTLLKDSKGRLWIGSDGGLDRYNATNDRFVHVRDESGFLDDAILCIVEDKSGYLWFSTTIGLGRLDAKTNDVRFYDEIDGLRSSRFRELLVHSKTGHIYAGGPGLSVFHPDSLKEMEFFPRALFTSIRYSEQRQGLNRFKEISSPGTREDIQLTYHNKILQFEISALAFRKTDRIQYAYMLEELHSNWVELGTSRDFALTNLAPGHYTLKIRSTNGDGTWSEQGTSLKIAITPPWYWNGWSKIIYLLLFSTALYFLYVFLLRRRLALAENDRLKELDAVKTKLYTNITHEFRTPITLIQGVNDQIKEEGLELQKESIIDKTEIVQRNSARLLHLVNQMLDLRKLESQSLPVHLIHGDIIAYLSYLVESFRSYAEEKGIDLQLSADPGTLFMDYDAEKFLTILSNMLSNAIKFTFEGGEVQVICQVSQRKERDWESTSNRLVHLSSSKSQEDQAFFEVHVQDSGVGITADQLPNLFDRFYQVDDKSTRQAEGTGIGLTLCKELVSLLNGDLKVESSPGHGSTFCFRLPIQHSAQEASSDPSSLDEQRVAVFIPPTKKKLQEDALAPSPDSPLVLIIEDNQEVAQFIGSTLEQQYRLIFAVDGEAGVNTALEEIPDLIVSDVMMPKKDGYEVCETLKHDPRTSHIPIILLTAKADRTSKLEGLQGGADAYLTKPFDREELLIRLDALFQGRQKMRDYYRSLVGLGQRRATVPEHLKRTQKEEDFIQRTRTAIEAHLTDPSFTIELLCKSVGMSKSQLHRKLTSLVELAPIQFVQQIRLDRARNLLEETDQRVGQIAYDCGFNDPDYFGRVFKKTFGMTPTEFRKQSMKKNR